jgi:FMN phosphatase YigB (HAD superfamily)
MNIKGLLVDIDDTLVRFRPGVKPDTSSLMQVLKKAGHELGGLTMTESAERVEWVKNNIRWWCWKDYIKKLELDENIFWDYAFDMESKYLEPSEPNLVKSFELLKEAGYELFITSNNPNTGIRHKMRLAAIPTDKQNELFTQLLGVAEMENMKWEKEYWVKAIANTGIKAENLAVIGDSFHEDYEVPLAVGVAMTFLIDPDNKYADQKSNTLNPVFKIAQIADELHCLHKKRFFVQEPRSAELTEKMPGTV